VPSGQADQEQPVRRGLRRRRQAPDGSGRAVSGTEAFRVIRSNLAVATTELAKPVVLVTSALEGEGKTSTCVGLAESLAATGQRVTLVDLDLRAPSAHRLVGALKEPGVTDVLLGHRSLSGCLQGIELATESPPRTSMRFLGAGTRVANPTEALSARRMRELLDELTAQSDIVLMDTPPVLPVADTLVIGQLAAGAIMVIEASKTAAPDARRAKDALIRNRTRLLGTVLNKFEPVGASLGYDDYGRTRPLLEYTPNGGRPADAGYLDRS
jgi:capsular exopolysaccharide synthesis family protein